MYFLEDLLGLTMDELRALLLRLAQAAREGRFDQVYDDLLPPTGAWEFGQVLI